MEEHTEWKKKKNHLLINLTTRWKSLSSVRLFATTWTRQSMEFSRPYYWVSSLFLLQGIFPTQGSNRGIPQCRWIFFFFSWATREALNNIGGSQNNYTEWKMKINAEKSTVNSNSFNKDRIWSCTCIRLPHSFHCNLALVPIKFYL